MSKGLRMQTSELYARRAYNFKVLIDARCPLSKSAAEIAADRGHLEFLKMLIAAGCPLGESAAEAAAEEGQVECPKVCIRKPQNYMPSGHIISKY